MDALIFGRKIIAYPVVDWQATGRENCLQITMHFRFLAYSALALFFSSLKYNEHTIKGKKKHFVHRGGKRFFVIM